MTIRVGIMGYGNLGRGVECALKQNPDMELTAYYQKRSGSVKILTEGVNVYPAKDAKDLADQVDVLILCGGSATDLPEQTPEYAKYFNVVDSFDTHAKIPEHFAAVDKAARRGRKHSGDLRRLGSRDVLLKPPVWKRVLPDGKDYTFWGRGVSQGHSDAIRRIAGVKDARQYTIPVESALEAIRSGETPELTTRQKHTRECFVVAGEGADKAAIEKRS